MAESALIRHLVAKVSMDTRQFSEGAKRAQREMTGLKAGFNSAFDSINSIARLIRGGGAIAGITALVASFGRAAKAMREMAAAGGSVNENFEAMIEKLPLLGSGLSIAKSVFGRSTADAQRLIREDEMKRRELLQTIQQQSDDVGIGSEEKKFREIEREADKILKLIAAMEGLRESEKQELSQAAVALAQKKQDELRALELSDALEREAEGNLKIIDSLEQLIETRDKFINQEEYLDSRKRREQGIRKSAAADAAFRAEADALIDATRTSAERLEADLATWKTMFDDGLISSDVVARLIKGRLGDQPQANLPNLAIRGTQAAESLISQQSVNRKKTEEEILKQIMEMVKTSKTSTELMRQIEKKLGGVNI